MVEAQARDYRKVSARVTLIVAALAVAAALALGLGMTRAITRPVAELKLVAQRLADGDLDQKIEAIERAGVDAVVSGDASCLMQIGGRLSRNGSKVRAMHLAELLAATDAH